MLVCVFHDDFGGGLYGSGNHHAVAPCPQQSETAVLVGAVFHPEGHTAGTPRTEEVSGLAIPKLHARGFYALYGLQSVLPQNELPLQRCQYIVGDAQGEGSASLANFAICAQCFATEGGTPGTSGGKAGVALFRGKASSLGKNVEEMPAFALVFQRGSEAVAAHNAGGEHRAVEVLCAFPGHVVG